MHSMLQISLGILCGELNSDFLCAESDDVDREPLPRIPGDPQPHRQVGTRLSGLRSLST
jgi:hypothetical protein